MTVRGQGSKWIRPERRLAIYARDGWACVWCGATDRTALSLDHLWGAFDNRSGSLVTSCTACNARKQARRLSSWLRHLRIHGPVAGIVARLRATVRRPVDVVAGRRLLADADVRRDRLIAGARWASAPPDHAQEEDECPF